MTMVTFYVRSINAIFIMYSDWNLEFVEFVESCGLVHNLWNLVDSPQFVESVESCGLVHNVKKSTIF